MLESAVTVVEWLPDCPVRDVRVGDRVGRHVRVARQALPHERGRGVVESVEADLSGAGHVGDEQLFDRKCHPLGEGLPPEFAAVRDALEVFDGGAASPLVVRERVVDVQGGGEGVVECDGVFHGELGARADGVVRGVGGVAEEYDVAAVPVLARNGAKARPPGAVSDQSVVLEGVGERVLQVLEGEPVAGGGGGGPVGGDIESCPPPCFLVGFDEEGAAVGGVRVACATKVPCSVVTGTKMALGSAKSVPHHR